MVYLSIVNKLVGRYPSVGSIDIWFIEPNKGTALSSYLAKYISLETLLYNDLFNSRVFPSFVGHLPQLMSLIYFFVSLSFISILTMTLSFKIFFMLGPISGVGAYLKKYILLFPRALFLYIFKPL